MTASVSAGSRPVSMVSTSGRMPRRGTMSIRTPMRARFLHGQLAGLPDRVEHGSVGAFVEPQNLRGIVRALKHRPILIRPEPGGDEVELGIGRQTGLEPVDHRIEVIASWTGV